MSLRIVLRNSAAAPIYEQIADHIAAAITSGELKEGDALPSLRTLAKDLRVSVITTTRAYSELTAQGLIESVPGKGAFVSATNPELLRERHYADMEHHLAKALDVAKRSGITRRDIDAVLDTMWGEGDDLR